ncbi:MAG: rod-binding protein [Spirochaetia bacterium]|nr:rod-binding protein [Spirochaetia bacterium]
MDVQNQPQIKNREEMERLFPGLIREHGTGFLRTPGESKFAGELKNAQEPLPKSGETSAGKGASADPAEEAKVKEAALQFQAMFINMMLKSMRATLHPENDMLFGGRTQEIFQDMLYDEYSKSMSKASGFPLADQIVTEVRRTMKSGEGGAVLDRARAGYEKNMLDGRIPSTMQKNSLDLLK